MLANLYPDAKFQFLGMGFFFREKQLTDYNVLVYVLLALHIWPHTGKRAGSCWGYMDELPHVMAGERKEKEKSGKGGRKKGETGPEI